MLLGLRLLESYLELEHRSDLELELYLVELLFCVLSENQYDNRIDNTK